MTKEKTLKNMAEMPMGKLILTTGIPMIISMVLQAVYNIVDSAFVSNMAEHGEEALNALTLAFPVQILLVALGIGTGVGTNALVSRCLGQGDGQKAGKAAGNSVTLAGLITLFGMAFGLFGVKAYIGSQTQNPLIFDMAVSYLRICCLLSFGNVFFAIFEKLLQSTGLSLYSSAAQIVGALINIVLDPIMIYGWFGVPKMGVSGAAYATVLGQVVSFVIAFLFHIKCNKAIVITRKSLCLDKKIVGEIYAIGLPAIIAQSLMSFMTYGLNIILGSIHENMVTAYGLYYKVQQFLMFAAFGMRDAITPIISFNYGQYNKERVTKGIRYGVLFTTVIMLAGLAALEIFTVPFAALFGLSGSTEQIFVSAVRIISVSLIFAGLNISLQGAFQGLTAGRETLLISLMRQLVFVLPVAFLLSLLGKTNAHYWFLMWFTFLFSEGVSAIFALVFMKNIYRRKVSVLLK